MGLFDMLSGAAHNSVKGAYERATGHSYDGDIRRYYDDWEWKDDYDIKRRYEELSEENSIWNAAELMALERLVKEKGLR